MSNFQMEMPLDQRDRLRALERQRELALKKRLGEEMERERAFMIERERGLSDRLLDRDRMGGDRMVGMGRFLERERELRLAGGEKPASLDRRLEGGLGVSRLESTVGVSRLDAAVGMSRLDGAVGIDRRLDTGVDRRLEAGAERDDGREGQRPGTRPASFDRLRPTDRERNGEREKIRDRTREDEGVMEGGVGGEKQKDRDESAGALQELVAQYKTALAELTFNSKPIITNLTIIAGENSHAAKGIAATVCAHILEVPNEQKLPSLYLLDSIVKNIGGDYVKNFAAKLPEVFCKAYRQVDPSTHPAMQHLFRTWRGVFPGAPLRLIETELQFSPSTNGPASTSNSARPVESPSQRPGHSIHVNPKYIEAQRQRMQQSTKVEPASTESNEDTSIHEVERSERTVLDSPKGWPDTSKRPALPRTLRGDGFVTESGYGRKTPLSYSDYDYGSSDPVAEIGRIADRDEGWERGWLRENEDALRPLEGGSGLRHGQRNGYELRQSSPRTLVDAYGNIRGPRAPRMPPSPAQPVQDLDTRRRGPSRSWRNSEEEEFLWEDMNPRLLDHARQRDSVRKEDWYSGDDNKSPIPGGLGRGKAVGLDQPLLDHLGWRRHGPLPLTDRTLAPESRLALHREADDRMPLLSLQQDIGTRFVSGVALDAPAVGGNAHSTLAHQPLASRLPQSLPQQLSPPASSRIQPLQVNVPNRNPSPNSVGSLGLLSHSVNLSLPSSSSGVSGTMAPNFSVRASVRPGLGSSFIGGSLNYGSLSPVTPASTLTFQQRQQLQRPPSPPPPAPPRQPQLPIRPHTPPLHQANFQPLQQQRVNHSKPIQHQVQAPGIHQPHSTQQPLPLHRPLQQLQPVHQLPQQPSAAQQLPQQLQPLQQILQAQPTPPSIPSSEQQLPSQHASQATAVVPQVKTQLLQSLQQLQHHLPSLPGSLLHQSQTFQPPQHLQAPPLTIQQGGQLPQLLQQLQQPALQLQQPGQQQLQQPAQQQLQQPSQPLLQAQAPAQQPGQQQLQQPAQQQLQQPPQSLLPAQAQAQQPSQLSQVSGYSSQSAGTGTDISSTSLLPAAQSQSNSNLLAAFLQSGLMPPSQASQILSQPRPSSPKVSAGSTESAPPQLSTQVQPPLPSGPPPLTFSIGGTCSSTVQSVLSLPPAVPTPQPAPVPLPTHVPVPALAHLPLYSSQPMRMVQPPLPPGPPPVSSQVISSASQPPVSGGPGPAPVNNLSSLLSSLMAQGLISASSSSSTPPILPQPSGGPVASNSSVIAGFTNPTLNLLPSGATLVPPIGSSVLAATPLSTTLETSLQTQEPATTAIDSSSAQKNTVVDPIGFDFKQEVLRERHEFVINALYSDFPRQCKTCGLRFKFQEEHSKHMDWHVSRNRRQKSSKKVSRKWLVSVKEWLSGTGASATEVAPSFFAEDIVTKPEEHETVAVPADENQSACAICGEPFEDFYSDETEEWMYKGAVYMNAPPSGVIEGVDSSHLGPIVHAKCRSESVAIGAADSAEEDELEEEDELGRRSKRVRY